MTFAVEARDRALLARAAGLAVATCLLGACGASDRTAARNEEVNSEIAAVFERCPEIVYLNASPISTGLGEEISVTSLADKRAIEAYSFNWFASSGAISDPWSSDTRYTCEEAGEQTLSLFLSDGVCADVLRTGVYCVDPEAPTIAEP